MARFLLKTEPGSYGWADLVRDGETEWDGVRNHAAARSLRAMTVGDEALFYHSGDEKAAVGVARIVRGAVPDGEDWVSVRIAPIAPLPRPVTLAAMKADPRLADFAMLRQPRLSVVPVSDAHWAAIGDLGGGG